MSVISLFTDTGKAAEYDAWGEYYTAVYFKNCFLGENIR